MTPSPHPQAASCNSAPQLSVLPPSLRLGRLLEQAVEDAEDEDDYDDLEGEQNLRVYPLTPTLK